MEGQSVSQGPREVAKPSDIVDLGNRGRGRRGMIPIGQPCRPRKALSGLRYLEGAMYSKGKERGERRTRENATLPGDGLFSSQPWHWCLTWALFPSQCRDTPRCSRTSHGGLIWGRGVWRRTALSAERVVVVRGEPFIHHFINDVSTSFFLNGQSFFHRSPTQTRQTHADLDNTGGLEYDYPDPQLSPSSSSSSSFSSSSSSSSPLQSQPVLPAQQANLSRGPVPSTTSSSGVDG